MPALATYQLLVDWNNDAVIGGGSASLTLSGNEVTDAVRATATEGDGVASPDSSMGIWATTTNHITNGGAETNTTGWTTNGSGTTVTRHTAEDKFGVACLNLVTTNASDQNGGIHHAVITVAAGQIWTFSAWIKRRVGSSTGTVRLGLSTGSPEFGDFTTAVVPTDSWVRYTLTITISASVTQITPVFRKVDGAHAYDVLIDGIQLEQKAAATPYKHTDGGTATRSAARVQLPTGLLTTTQWWFAARIRIGFPSSLGTSAIGFPSVFGWLQTVQTERIIVYWHGDTKTWNIERDSGGTGGDADSAVDSFAVGDHRTIIAYGTATSVAISLQGANFNTDADTSIPAITNLPEIGSRGDAESHLNGTVLWAAGGSGILSNADAATIHANGDSDPSFASLPGTPTFVWSGSTSTLTVGSTEDITADIDGSQPIEWTTGRDTAGSPTAQASAGTFSCVLHNDDGKYSSFNASSPLYGMILPGRRVMLQAVYNSVTYTLWCGYLANVVPYGNTQEFPKVRLTAHGALAKLNQAVIGISHQGAVGQPSGSVISTILNAAGWPIGDRAIDTGETTIDIAIWPDTVTPLEALREIEESELGFVREATDSFKLVFESRHHRLKTDHRTALKIWPDPSVAGSLDYLDIVQDDALQFIFNRARAEITPRVISAATVLWTYPGVAIELPPLTTIRVTAIHDPSAGPMLGWVTPTISTVPGADIIVALGELLWDKGSGGTGGTVETDLVVTATHMGLEMEIVIQNTSANRWIVGSIQARGQTVTEGVSTIVSTEDATSIAKYGPRQWPSQGRFIGTLTEAQTQVETIVNEYKEPRPLLSWTHVANLDTDHMLAALTLKVSDRVTVEATGELTKLGIERDFFIEGIRHHIEGVRHSVQYLGSPVNVYNHHYWILGTGKLNDSAGLDNARLAGW